MYRQRLLLTLLTPLLIAGCAHSDAPAKAERPGDGPARRDQVIGTALEPMSAATRVAEVYNSLGFDGLSDRSQFSPARAEQGDHFYARAAAITQNKERMYANCRWVRDGLTEVEFTSNLSEEQHEYVVGRIRKALAEPGR
jgi:hypothetical protein